MDPQSDFPKMYCSFISLILITCHSIISSLFSTEIIVVMMGPLVGLPYVPTWNPEQHPPPIGIDPNLA